MLLGSFITQQFTDAAVLADIDFFPFPEVKVEGTDAVEAPIDGLMLSKKGAQNQAAKDMLQFMGTGAGQEAYYSVDKSNIMTAKDADTSGYSAFTKKLAGVIAEREVDQPVLRPRRAARHGEQRARAGDAELHQERHDQPREHRVAGEDPVRPAVTTDDPVDRGAGDHQVARAAAAPPPADAARPHRARGDDRHPDPDPAGAGVDPDAGVGRAVVLQVGRARAVRLPLQRADELQLRLQPGAAVLAGGAAQRRLAAVPRR